MKIEIDGVGEVDTDTVFSDWVKLAQILEVPGAMRGLQRELNIKALKPSFDVESLKEAVKISIFQIENRKSDVKALQEIVGM